MSRLRQFGLMTAGAGLVALSVVVSCSHSVTMRDAGPPTVQGNAGGVQQSGSSAVRSEAPVSQLKIEHNLVNTAVAHALAPKALADHAFGNSSILSPTILPAGTLLTVRLEKALTAYAPETGGAFDAVVDEPVVIRGITVIPQGTSVAGHIEAARASALKRSRAYLRLTLASIEVGGRDLAVQTSSLFARGRSDTTAALENASSVDTLDSISLVNSVHVEKGRQLTFRLIGAVAVPSEQSIATR